MTDKGSLAYTQNVQFVNQLQTNLTDVSTLFKQLIKGSKSSDLLTQACKNFATLDSTITGSEEIFHKFTALSMHLGYQQEAIQKHIELSTAVREQIQSINSLLSH